MLEFQQLGRDNRQQLEHNPSTSTSDNLNALELYCQPLPRLLERSSQTPDEAVTAMLGNFIVEIANRRDVENLQSVLHSPLPATELGLHFSNIPALQTAAEQPHTNQERRAEGERPRQTQPVPPGVILQNMVARPEPVLQNMIARPEPPADADENHGRIYRAPYTSNEIANGRLQRFREDHIRQEVLPNGRLRREYPDGSWAEMYNEHQMAQYTDRDGSVLWFAPNRDIVRAREPGGREWHYIRDHAGGIREVHDASPLDRDLARVEAALSRVFNRADADRNGFVSRRELEALLADQSLGRDDALAVAALVRRFDEITRLSRDQRFGESEISRADLNQLLRIWRTSLNGGSLTESERNLIDGTDTQHGIRSFIAERQSNLEGVCRNLYQDVRQPLSSIVPDAVIQGNVGNCNFVAAVASLAQVDPERIRNMITEDGDGNFTVRFPGYPHPIQVQRPTDAELAHHGVGSQHGLWAVVLQRAYGICCYQQCSPNILSGPRGPHAYPPRGTEIEQGHGPSLDFGLQLLGFRSGYYQTGWPNGSLEGTYNTLLSILPTDARPGRPITALIIGGLREGNEPRSGLPDWHHYSVLALEDDPNHLGSPEHARVILRNPHGSLGLPPGHVLPPGMRDEGNGRISMSIQDFNRTFSTVVYSS